MKIIICDDHHQFISILDGYIRDYIEKLDISYEIISYSSGESLIASNIDDVDVIFLDIAMPGLDGIETARILRRRNSQFILVFVTAYLEYVVKGYGVNAFSYVLKQDIGKVFNSLMDDVLDKVGLFKPKISFDFINGRDSFLTEELIYLESRKHKVLFHFSDKNKITRHLYGKLDLIQKELPNKEFVRIHKSFMVNLIYLLDIKHKTAFLINGTVLPVSQRYLKEAKNEMVVYKASTKELPAPPQPLNKYNSCKALVTAT
ncbi:MAG: LytTR family DNA-binding domain-containing protein [Lachnospiraceae bacterium]|nr:LytTR family DNA-binding domain-containing protein [Lachnospiraceae bacterium]